MHFHHVAGKLYTGRQIFHIILCIFRENCIMHSITLWEWNNLHLIYSTTYAFSVNHNYLWNTASLFNTWKKSNTIYYGNSGNYNKNKHRSQPASALSEHLFSPCIYLIKSTSMYPLNEWLNKPANAYLSSTNSNFYLFYLVITILDCFDWEFGNDSCEYPVCMQITTSRCPKFA